MFRNVRLWFSMYYRWQSVYRYMALEKPAVRHVWENWVLLMTLRQVVILEDAIMDENRGENRVESDKI